MVKLNTSTQQFGAVTADKSLPNPRRLIEALRQIGYSLEQSIADLVDNCINAEAKNVLIRFTTDGDKIVSVAVVDDGYGMSPKKLADAMQFGSDEEAEAESLGKYGMGLKLASLSFAKSLTVVTRRDGEVSARRWTVEGIAKGWLCDVLDGNELAEYFEEDWQGIDLSGSGTLVIWEDIDKLVSASSSLAKTMGKIRAGLKSHLGLCFHRFLEDKKLSIFIDEQEINTEPHRIRDEIAPLNPFEYGHSGHPEYPKKFKTTIEGVGGLRLEAHIWPANSDSPNYKLGGKTSAKQGFYFYRNDRLIQSGGWNGVVRDETEPHGSLARVRIDLPPDFDDSFGLNVQKSAVIAPPAFIPGIENAVADDGDTFQKFRRKADTVYRKKDTGAIKHRPHVLGSGIPNSLCKLSRRLLADDGEKARHVDFEWDEFTSGDLFTVDQERGVILLNRAFRHDLLRGQHASKSDLPLLKILIFFLAKEDLDKSRMSAKRKEELRILNTLISNAASLGKG